MPDPASGRVSSRDLRMPYRLRPLQLAQRGDEVLRERRGLGGSSAICSQPMGGDPGGEMRKLFSIAGGRRCEPPGGVSVSGLHKYSEDKGWAEGLNESDMHRLVRCIGRRWDVRLRSRIDC